MCTNTSFDPSNCGTCGNVCAFAQGSAACAGGGCFLASCDAGLRRLQPHQADGCEIEHEHRRRQLRRLRPRPARSARPAVAASAPPTCRRAHRLLEMDDAGVDHGRRQRPQQPARVASGQRHLPARCRQAGLGRAIFGGAGYIRVAFPNNALNQGSGIAIPQGNITFSMWFKTSRQRRRRPPGRRRDDLGQRLRSHRRQRSGHDVQYNAWNEVNMTGPRPVNDGNWHHMTYVLDEVERLPGLHRREPRRQLHDADHQLRRRVQRLQLGRGVLDWLCRQWPFQRRLLHWPHR